MADRESTAIKRVRTPYEELLHDAANAADVDPDTAELMNVRVVGDEIELTLSGEYDGPR